MMKIKLYSGWMLLFSIIQLGCVENTTPLQYSISIMIDRTEPDGYFPSGESILQMLPNHNLSDGLELSITNIGDTYYNRKQSFKLNQGETGLLANEDKRRKQYKYLHQQFLDSLESCNRKKYSYTRSDIFRSVVKELICLSSKEDNRELWLFSDLKEHSFFSVYNPKELNRLYKNLEAVQSEFEESVSLDADLTGIIIHIIYQPNLNDAELFSQMVALYRRIFEPRGVVILVGIEEQINLSL